MTGEPSTQLVHDLKKGISVPDSQEDFISVEIDPTGEAYGIDLPAIMNFVMGQYALPAQGMHGPSHWGRVLANGLVLATVTNLMDPPQRVNEKVVVLFALFHDVCRQNEGNDPYHGLRAADLAVKTLSRYPHMTGGEHLEVEQILALEDACIRHARGEVTENLTIGCCWDADRLDLPRHNVRIVPDLKLFSTSAAIRPDILGWAVARAIWGFTGRAVWPWAWGEDVEKPHW